MELFLKYKGVFIDILVTSHIFYYDAFDILEYKALIKRTITAHLVY